MDGNLDRLRSCIVHFVYVEKGARERGRKGEEEEEEEEEDKEMKGGEFMSNKRNKMASYSTILHY